MFGHINKNIALYGLIGTITPILAFGGSGGDGGGDSGNNLEKYLFIQGGFPLKGGKLNEKQFFNRFSFCIDNPVRFLS